VFQQQVKQLEARKVTISEQCQQLQKTRDEAVTNFCLNKSRLDTVSSELADCQAKLEQSQTKLTNQKKRAQKFEYEAKEGRKGLKTKTKSCAALERQNKKLNTELKETISVQNSLGGLLLKREEEVKLLEEDLRKMKEEQQQQETLLRDQFQEELNNYLKIRESEYQQEKDELIKVLKEEHAKNILSHKEILTSKNHDIENLKDTNARLKKISDGAQKEKDKFGKQKKKLESKVKKLDMQLQGERVKNGKILKEKEKLLGNLREKYLGKATELKELTQAHTLLSRELQVYREMIFSEEERMRKKRKLNPKQEQIDGRSSKFDLGPFDLNEKKLSVKCKQPIPTSLEGWVLTNRERTHTFYLPNVKLHPEEELTVFVGAQFFDAIPDANKVYWQQDVWDGSGSECIQLVSPDGRVRQACKINGDMLGKKDDTCCVM